MVQWPVEPKYNERHSLNIQYNRLDVRFSYFKKKIILLNYMLYRQMFVVHHTVDLMVKDGSWYWMQLKRERAYDKYYVLPVLFSVLVY